ncbi:MAG: hypothetical protein U1B80_09785 [Anaerolineaceae bacterium]|nr:hypothetical protein [Anaerolineaceae bacterium]
MFNDRDLQELLDFSASDPVLSVYLNTDPQEGNADAYRLRLRSMLKDVKSVADVAVVERYFNHEYDWAGRSVAVFSCNAQKFFRAFPFAISIRSQVHIADRTSVQPLTNLMDIYGGYGVALVDQQGARLFYFHLGELREQEGLLGVSIKRTKRGGASSFPGRRGGTAGQTRAVEEAVERNMRESAEFAMEFFESHHVRRILIGGTDDNVAQFRGMLPKSWQSLIVGSFPISMTASHTEVLARAMEIGIQSERRREDRLVENLLTNAAKGGQAVVGLKDTLDAVNASRALTLVIAEEYHDPGFRCPGCDRLSPTAGKACETCGKTAEPIPDLVEAAINAVLRNRGGVEVVHASPVFQKAGSIGAILRY